MIKWLFFDLGSTLIDESECEAFRLNHLLAQTNAPGREEVLRTMAYFASHNLPHYKETARKYNLQTVPWPGYLEKLYDGVPSVLETLSRRYKLGIIANQSLGTQQRLMQFGIEKYFDVIVSSAELGIAKPDPEIFQFALRTAQCEPQEAAMIGDRLDNDIEPAGKLGMYTVWIRQGFAASGNPALIEKYPDRIVARLEEILTIF